MTAKKPVLKFVSAGFPWHGKFKDMDQVKRYFSHDRLQCLLCGRDYVNLGLHIVASHKIPIEDYQRQFDLPWTYGLIGQSMRQRLSESITETRNRGKLPPSDPELTRKAKRRKISAPARNSFGMRALKRAGLTRKWQEKDYLEFLNRVASGRIPSEVGQDKDMPKPYLFNKFVNQNPKIRKKFDEIWDQLPFEVQSRGLYFGPTIRKKVMDLRFSGKTWMEIADIMGCSTSTVRNLWFQIKHNSKGPQKKEMEAFEKRNRIDPKLFDEFLNRIAKGRTAAEVGKDKDMPRRLDFDKHVRDNPAFRRKYDNVWNSLPFSVQARGRRPGKSLRDEVIKLHNAGLSLPAIAKKMKITLSTVTYAWNSLAENGTKKEKEIVEKFRQNRVWTKADMIEFLKRVKSGRLPRDVSADKDMPDVGIFYAHLRSSPQLARKYKIAWESLPFSIQAKGLRLGERFRARLTTLKSRGLSFEEISKKLGVNETNIKTHWYKLQKDLKKNKKTSKKSRRNR